MEEEKDILGDWKKRQKPAVPEGFFDHFVDDLMARIEMESGFLGQLKKSAKPSVPNGYFDSLLPSLDTKADSFSIEKLQKSEQGTVPEDFFESFPDTILNRVEQTEKESKKGRIIPLRIVTIVTSAAAAIAIMLSITNFFKEEPVTNPVVAEVESEEEVFDTYLSYLDEGEIIDFIIENDVTIEDTSSSIEFDDYLDYSEADIEEYYLDELL